MEETAWIRVSSSRLRVDIPKGNLIFRENCFANFARKIHEFLRHSDNENIFQNILFSMIFSSLEYKCIIMLEPLDETHPIDNAGRQTLNPKIINIHYFSHRSHNRVACSNFRHPAQTSSITKYKFLQV